MRPTALLRYVCALAFVLACTGWGANAQAQQALSYSEKLSYDSANTPSVMDRSVYARVSQASRVASETVLEEDFSSETFPDNGWSVYDIDGEGNQWERTTTRYASPP